MCPIQQVLMPYQEFLRQFPCELCPIHSPGTEQHSLAEKFVHSAVGLNLRHHGVHKVRTPMLLECCETPFPRCSAADPLGITERRGCTFWAQPKAAP